MKEERKDIVAEVFYHNFLSFRALFRYTRVMRKVLFIALVALLLASSADSVFAAITDRLAGSGLTSVTNDFEKLLVGTAAGAWLERVIELFGLFALGAVLLYFTRGFSQKTVAYMNSHVMKNFSYGIVGVVLAPFALIVLALTLIGIPLVVFLGALWVILLFYGIVFGALWVGRIVYRTLFRSSDGSMFWELVLGGTLWVVTFDWLPALFSGTAYEIVIGITLIVKLFFVLWAAGAAIRAKIEAIEKGYT